MNIRSSGGRRNIFTATATTGVLRLGTSERGSGWRTGPAGGLDLCWGCSVCLDDLALHAVVYRSKQIM